MRVSALHSYPVKSLGGLSLQQTHVGPRGLQGDREFMLVDAEGRFLTQRTLPQMTQFTTERLTSGDLLIRWKDDQLIIESAWPADQQRRTVTVWRDTFEALCCREAASAWFSERLGQPVTLMRMLPEVKRRLDPTYAPSAESENGFSDAYPALAVCEGSLAQFNRRLDAPIPMNRFRGNLVIEGSTPWAEDTWAVVQIGSVIFDAVKPCTRCVVITTDQQTGARTPEILKALTREHLWQNQGAVFGMNLVPRNTGLISVGDTVKVLQSVPAARAWPFTREASVGA